MKRKIGILVLLILAAVLVLSACGGTAMNGGDERLVGSWEWNDMVYYVFREGGSGTMGGSAIRWSADGNRLSICMTPGTCGDRCPAPLEGPFSLSSAGGEENAVLQFNGFRYTRR